MKTIITSSLLVLSASTVFAAGGVKINGDVTLEQGVTPPRVLYFSNGSSQWFATPWSYKTDTSDIYFLGGNVGIGNANPSTALDVNGTVTATGFSGNGSGLTNLNAPVADGSISTSKIANGAVTDAKISGTISMSKRPMSVYPFSYSFNTVTPSAFSYAFVGTPLTITTPYLQKLIGSASAIGYVNSGSYAVYYGLCYQPSGSGSAPNNFTFNAPYVIATGNNSTFSIASSIDLPAGSWNVGFCVGNNPSSLTINMLNINGWIMATN